MSYNEQVVWIQLVHSNGLCRYTVNQHWLTDEARQQELQAAATTRPARRVVIQASRETTAADLAVLLLHLRQTGLGRVTVAVPASSAGYRGFLVLPLEIRSRACAYRLSPDAYSSASKL